MVKHCAIREKKVLRKSSWANNYFLALHTRRLTAFPWNFNHQPTFNQVFIWRSTQISSRDPNQETSYSIVSLLQAIRSKVYMDLLNDPSMPSWIVSYVICLFLCSSYVLIFLSNLFLFQCLIYYLDFQSPFVLLVIDQLHVFFPWETRFNSCPIDELIFCHA